MPAWPSELAYVGICEGLNNGKLCLVPGRTDLALRSVPIYLTLLLPNGNALL